MMPNVTPSVTPKTHRGDAKATPKLHENDAHVTPRSYGNDSKNVLSFKIFAALLCAFGEFPGFSVVAIDSS